MTVRERERSGTLTVFSTLLQFVRTYRMPMIVKKAVVFRRFPRDEIYYRCPRCQELLEREFVAYCSRCGQCLDWRGYRKATKIYHQAKSQRPAIKVKTTIIHFLKKPVTF